MRKCTPVLRLFAQIISAICYVHGKGFAHRDIKLGIVLLDCKQLDKANCFLADFGLSRVGRKKDGTLIKTSRQDGTPNYMSPEVTMVREYSG